MFHLLDWKLEITRWRGGGEWIWIFPLVSSRVLTEKLKNFRSCWGEQRVNLYHRARRPKKKKKNFIFTFSFQRKKQSLHTKKLAVEFLHRLGVKWRGATNESKVCATITIVLYLNTREFPRFSFFLSFSLPPWQSLEAVFTTFLLSSGTLVTVGGWDDTCGVNTARVHFKIINHGQEDPHPPPSISCERLKTLTFMTLLRLRASYGDETRQTDIKGSYP